MCWASWCESCTYSHYEDIEKLQRLRGLWKPYGHKSKCRVCGAREYRMVEFYTMEFVDNEVDAMYVRRAEKSAAREKERDERLKKLAAKESVVVGGL